MRRSLILALPAIALLSLLVPARAPAQQAPKVANVLQIDVAPGELQKFLAFPKRAQEIAKKNDSPGVTRVWLSTFAGPNAGTVTVVVEYPSMSAMVEYQAKIGPSPEWQQFVADVTAAGYVITSNSVVVEQSY